MVSANLTTNCLDLPLPQLICIALIWAHKCLLWYACSVKKFGLSPILPPLESWLSHHTSAACNAGRELQEFCCRTCLFGALCAFYKYAYCISLNLTWLKAIKTSNWKILIRKKKKIIPHFIICFQMRPWFDNFEYNRSPLFCNDVRQYWCNLAECKAEIIKVQALLTLPP